MARRPEPAARSGAGARPAWRVLAGVLQVITGPWTAANAVGWIKLIALFLFVSWAFIQLYRIPSGSMEPTLHGHPSFFRGDRVVANKLVFGPRIPFTTIRLWKWNEPRRWDIVVFHAVEPNAPHSVLVKRVAGLPGERVHIEDGKLYINGEELVPPEGLREILSYSTRLAPDEDDIGRMALRHAQAGALPYGINRDHLSFPVLRDDLQRLHQRVGNRDVNTLKPSEVEDLIRGTSSTTMSVFREWLANQFPRARYGVLPDDEFSLVPEGHYFLLGDNTDHSVDGRFFGWVPHNHLYGRAFAILLPPGRMRDLTGFSTTWWGKLLVFGLPALFILYELTRACVGFTWRVSTAAATDELARRERIYIDRLAYGLRIPFTDFRVLGKRPPGPGELVAYIREQDGVADLYFGRVAREHPRSDTASVLVIRHSGGETFRDETPPEAVVGRVAAVWWPVSKRRAFGPRTS